MLKTKNIFDHDWTMTYYYTYGMKRSLEEESNIKGGRRYRIRKDVYLLSDSHFRKDDNGSTEIQSCSDHEFL